MFLKIDEVSNILNRSQASIYRDLRRGAFPLPIRLGPNSIRWIESEIREWVINQPRVRYSGGV